MCQTPQVTISIETTTEDARKPSNKSPESTPGWRQIDGYQLGDTYANRPRWWGTTWWIRPLSLRLRPKLSSVVLRHIQANFCQQKRVTET